jgi:hypothetical protein
MALPLNSTALSFFFSGDTQDKMHDALKIALAHPNAENTDTGIEIQGTHNTVLFLEI